MSRLVLFSALFGVFFGLLMPAEAGQRNWRDCGGSRYEGCNPPRSVNRNHAGHHNFNGQRFNHGQQFNYGQGYNKTTYKKTHYESWGERTVKVTKNKWKASILNGVCTCVRGQCPKDPCDED